MSRELPSGSVTFLFTDVEGSTKLLQELGAQKYAEALAEHRRIVREAVEAHGGVEVDTQGDAFFVAFPTAPGALRAASDALQRLQPGPIRVRMGIHTGAPHLTDEGYVGVDVHRAARIAACGHGGQVLVSASTASLLAANELRELGEHRLKDFDEPVALYQLGSGSFPPLKTISNTNLPRPASSFVGRQKEVEEVLSLLQDGVRLLTLTGPGGSGKTRLAIEAATDLVPKFKAGVFWVGLATLRDATLVTDTIAQTLGAKSGLAGHIAERELLLLLDNLEQVIAAAPELASLVESCPNLTLLVTSRELLRVRGEVEYPVLPLAEPDAAELFSARAQVEADDNTVHALCRALDDLPLALELAAARTSVLSPKQILARISQRLDLFKGGRDADPRQQTLRATIEWSYELFSTEEQQLFARLAVFAGGCSFEVAEEVTDADLDTLQSLVDKSLVRHSEERFWLLETIREYATERLDDAGETDALRRRHAEHFLETAEEIAPKLRGGQPGPLLDRLDDERDNLRAALDWLQASGESQLALRLAGALWTFWYLRENQAEGRRRLESVLRADGRSTVARGQALNGAAALALNAGDHATARLRAEEALELLRKLGDEWGTAYAVFTLGHVAADQEDHERARRYWEESLRSFRELGDDHYTLLATDGLAWTYGGLGDPERRRQLHEDNLRQARAQSNERIVALTLDQLAAFARDEGRIEDALSMLKESVCISSELGDRRATAETLCRLAHTLAAAGRAEAATRLLSRSDALYEEIGGGVLAWVAEVTEETRATIRAQLDEAAFAEAWERGRELTIDDAVALTFD